MKTKKFRVAKAGQTTDGRAIPLEHIQQMADNYNPATYGARVNLEHIKSLHADSFFKCYGDVVSLSIEQDGDDTYLVAEIDPTEDLVKLAEARQKVYFSIEYNANFADTGSAYLMGLACTDSPASLGTSYMTFCQQHPADNPLNARKANPENVISTAEFSANFEPNTFADNGGDSTSLYKQMKAFFSAFPAESPAQTEHKAQADKVAETLKQMPERLNTIEEAMKVLAKGQDELNDKFSQVVAETTATKTEVTALHTELDNTPEQGFTKRPPATGSNADYLKTDC